MTHERPSYTERTPSPTWVYVLIGGVLLLTSYAVLVGGDIDLPVQTRLAIVGALLGSGVLFQLLVGGMTVRVFTDRIAISMGTLGIVRTRVLVDDVQAVESVRYHPLREFGGWGIRGWGKKRAWTSRGDQAVVRTLTDDRKLYVGSDRPQRLEERIRTVAGDRLG